MLKAATVKDLKRRTNIPIPKFAAKIRVGRQKLTLNQRNLENYTKRKGRPDI